jgi:hypothetical protein
MTFNCTPTKSSSVGKTNEKAYSSSFWEVFTNMRGVIGSTIVILGLGATIAEYANTKIHQATED